MGGGALGRAARGRRGIGGGRTGPGGRANSAPLRGRDLKTVGEFTVGADETIPFVLSYGPSHLPPPRTIDAERALHDTETFWQLWSNRCTVAGPRTDAIKRLLVVLKALTYTPTGGIVTVPTTSLPEQLGGVRNWDYRYCWLRDATFTLLTLMHAGYYNGARVAGLAVSRRGGQPPAAADHVRSRRRASTDGMGSAVAARV